MAKNRLDFEAHLSRHPHDVSAGYTSSLTTGPIVPQYFHILSPGDTIYYNTKLFVRFKDVVTAFLGEVDVHLDYFFVPLQMLYLPFGQIFAQTNDVVSSSFKNMPVKDSFPLLANFPYYDGDGVEHLGLDFNPSSFHNGHDECYGKETVRLLDALGVNPLAPLHFSGQPSVEGQIDDFRCFNPLLSPWAFAAYQAIYQNFYRNDEFEKFNIQAYNIDQYFDLSYFDNVEMTKLRYVQRPSDYFTSVRVSPIASGINTLGNSYDAGHSNLGDLLTKTRQFLSPNDNYTPADIYGNEASSSFDTVTTKDSYLNQGMASSIRALFAVDKFLRVYGRAGKTYDDQILAHFGQKIPHDVKHQATRLVTYHTAIGSDPVYSTSTSGVDSGSVLGQVGGQASGSISVEGNGKGKYAAKFTAPVHGVFMAVVYAVTKPRYSCTFNKLHLLKDRLSFPIPEYDKLGAQPLYAFEAYPHLLGLENSDFGVHRIGWQNRYQEFKKKYNRVSLNYLHSDMEDYLGAENNSYSAWVLSRQPFGGFGTDSLYDDRLVYASDLFERPDALNSVMAVPYDGTWHNEYYAHPHEILDTDPLITEFMCEAKLVSFMSETGEPDMGM